MITKTHRKMSNIIYLIKYHDSYGSQTSIKGIFDRKEDADKAIIKELEHKSSEHSYSLYMFKKNQVNDGKFIYTKSGKGKVENPWD